MKYLENELEKRREIKKLELEIKKVLGANKIKIKKMPFVEACIFAEEKKLSILNNSSIDKILFLFNLEERSRFFENSLIWTGTIISYPEEEKSFIESRMYNAYYGGLIFEIDKMSGLKYILPISKDLAKLRRAAIVLEHPDYELKWDNNKIIIYPKSIKVLCDFPLVRGEYYLDEKFGLPVIYNKENPLQSFYRCYLLRDLDCFLGPVARSPSMQELVVATSSPISWRGREFYTILYNI